MVKKIVSVDFDAIGDSHKLKIRARLKNNWLIDLWEHVAPGLRRYSYHVFFRNRMIVRWDMLPIFQASRPSRTTSISTGISRDPKR